MYMSEIVALPIDKAMTKVKGNFVVFFWQFLANFGNTYFSTSHSFKVAKLKM